MRIDRESMSKNNKIFIIAEAGVNHNGSVSIAKKMIDAAAKAGADAVKFQTFRAEELATRRAPKAKYQQESEKLHETQYAMLKKMELSAHDHKELMRYCAARNIKFLSSPFDMESIDLLNSMGLAVFKIPSGEITNLPYLKKIGALRKKVILSTGMADFREVKKAVEILLSAGTSRRDITVMHCTTEYPAPFKEANLRAIVTLKNKLKMRIGYSDHTEGVEAAIAASALGASVIEKHFTLDRCMAGPDHKASIEPDELEKFVKAIRNIELALGNGIKRSSASESRNRMIVRKSIVAKRPIRRGEAFTDDNIAAKRPSGGISPMNWKKVLGRTARKDFKRDEAIKL